MTVSARAAGCAWTHARPISSSLTVPASRRRAIIRPGCIDAVQVHGLLLVRAHVPRRGDRGDALMAQEKVLMKGNEAMAEAAIRAGCRFFFGYPITPQTEVAAYMAKRMPKDRRHVPAGRKRDRGHQHGLRRVVGRRSRDDVVVFARASRSRARASRIWRAPTCPASSSTCSAAARALAASSPPSPTTGRPPAPRATATFQVLVFAPVHRAGDGRPDVPGLRHGRPSTACPP